MADVLVNTSAIQSGRRDSNPRSSPWQGDAVPLSYSRVTADLLTPRRFSAETQDRTADTAIFSRVLYQLSYLGVKRRVFYNSADRLSSNLRQGSSAVRFTARRCSHFNS